MVEIRITETLSRVISIDTISVEDAISQVKNMYQNEEIILDYSDCSSNVTIEKKHDSFESEKDFLLSKVISYMIKDEEKHYEELGKPENHIYNTLIKLKQYI